MASLDINLERLSTARDNIALAIGDKGITVPSGSGFEDFSSLIGNIDTGLECLYTATYGYDGTTCYFGYGLVTKQYIVLTFYGYRSSRGYGSYFKMGDSTLVDYILDSTLMNTFSLENTLTSNNKPATCYYDSGAVAYLCNYSIGSAYTGPTANITWYQRNL